MKMNKRIKAKWVAALRSGDYTQARGTLRTRDNTFCCLGVLCNIHAQEHPAIAAVQGFATHYMGHGAMLPPELHNWAKLGPSHSDTLMTMNDNGKSFATIAAYIERNL